MLENKFYKVGQSGGSYVVAYFFNPITKAEKSMCVRDYDYSDCSRDRDDLYYMEIDQVVKRMWLHEHGQILEGDTVKVVKGRTLEHGFVGKVRKICDYHNRYGRWVATYVYFEEGGKINVANVEILSVAE